ncbi:MAG: hypothetical protein PHP50_03445 [Lachnospiraceae bacterium]|nr:hypothetical protein [Lachnospiraceae bacterium]
MKEKNKIWQVLKIIFVCLLCFFGTGFTIMAFHNDIGIRELFAGLYQMITGENSDGFTVLEISYSIGLFVGITLFFNHLGGKKLTGDPTPIEVELYKYQKDVDDTKQNQSKGKQNQSQQNTSPKNRDHGKAGK